MKILVLLGSGRKHGNTDQIADMIVDEMQQEASQRNVPFEAEKVYLIDQDIHPCRGCRICFERGEEKCPLADDLLPLKAKLKAADGVLIASPVYVDDVSGLTKNWIDRMAHVCHRPEFAGKYAYLLVTVGSTPIGHAMRTLQIAFSTWGFRIVGQAGFKTDDYLKREEAQMRFKDRTRAIAQRFFTDIHTEKALSPTFFSLMMFRIQQIAWGRIKGPQFQHDLGYWHDQGWLDLHREFYIPHHAPQARVFLARLAGTLIAPFVS
ncbi:MAG TPA: NAD(P)H-dependent oxidoreductase [Longilinea sp.]|nr:NAD(P)H-dependent oxidoreductase [Longilinea sp.]